MEIEVGSIDEALNKVEELQERRFLLIMLMQSIIWAVLLLILIIRYL